MAVERTLREMGVTPDERMLKRYSELNLAQWHLLEQGKITRSQVKVQRYVNLFREYHIEGDPAEAAKVYEAYLAIGHYYVEGAEEEEIEEEEKITESKRNDGDDVVLPPLSWNVIRFKLV